MSAGDARDLETTFTRRAILLGCAAGTGFAVLGGRLHQIQVRQADRYALLSEDNQFNHRLLTPSRGRLLDRFGQPLAENEENYTVLMVPENARDPEALLQRLALIVPLSAEKRQAVLREAERAPEFQSVTVVDNLTWRQFAAVNLHAPELPGIVPIVGETRVYPMGETFAHVTGYVGKADRETAGDDPLLNNPTFRVGREGMERALDTQLRGAAGSLKVEVDALGRVVRELPDPETAATPGRDVRLTLDAGLQQHAIEALSVERTASGVVIDVRTGDILAMASHPAYDPNHFARGMSTAEYRALEADERNPLFPWAMAGEYPPGSTFKPMVALAAMRHGAVAPSERIYCSGRITFAGQPKHCWKAHGSVDLHDALKGSCDIYFYEVGRRLGIERIAETAREFGLGSAPEIGLRGVRPGLVPDEAWKRRVRGEPWYAGETLNAAIGQGDVLATPLQLAVMAARLASRRQVAARLVYSDETPEFAPLDFAPEALDTVWGGMRAVCEEPGGTAYSYLRILSELDFGEREMAGKSGTSQVMRITQAERAAGLTEPEDLPWRRRDHALFVGFAPYDNPRYAAAAVAQHGIAGSRVTGPMVQSMLHYALEHNSGRPQPSPLASL